MSKLSERIIEVLRTSGLISEADIQKVLLQSSKEQGAKLKDILVRMGVVEEKELASLLSVELNIPFLNLAKYKINPDMYQVISEKLARKYKIVPVSLLGDNLVVAMSDPFNVFAIDDTAMMTKHKVDFVISTEKEIQLAIDRLYTNESDAMNLIAKEIDVGGDKVKVVKNEDDLDTFYSSGGATDAPIVKIVDLMLREALKKRASDIHIEPFEKDVRVRYRVDGALEEVLTIPKKNKNAVLTRLKIMSRLDITESRIPQDGRFKIRLKNKEVDFRVSILPVHFGSKVVMRILDKNSINMGLDRLGFFPETTAAFNSAVSKPFGMILVTGPTGSGKSTTLYSVLNQLNTPEKNIITIEDPIEYQVKGITQIQTKTEIGLDFASGLRAILRQSPDIVMVGEIRDSETADIAVKASLTGQLVLSTLHTNDAAGAVTRLIDMGTEPFLIASSVILVAAQRLCRTVCPSCKEKEEIPEKVFHDLGVSLDKIVPNKKERNFFRGRGCEKCRKTGYYGRMSVLETLVVDHAIREMVLQRSSSHE